MCDAASFFLEYSSKLLPISFPGHNFAVLWVHLIIDKTDILKSTKRLIVIYVPHPLSKYRQMQFSRRNTSAHSLYY